MRQLLEFCESRQDWVLDATAALARAESPTPDKAAVNRCGELAARLATEAGAQLKVITSPGSGDHLSLAFSEGSPRVILLGHLDTVWPLGSLGRMPVRQEAGCLYGPGVLDMKAGIVLGILAVQAARQAAAARLPGITMLLTADEETGSHHSRRLIEAQARQSDVVLVLEPSLPGGALKTARKATGEFELTVLGVEAHAGVEPEKGVSAILELAEQVLAIHALERPDVGTTVNVGTITGGTRPNVVAGEARAVIDARAATSAEARRLEQALRQIGPRRPGTRVRISGGFERPPLERSAAGERLFQLARSVAARLGFELDEGSTGGGSDGNFTAALGVPTLDGLGAVGAGAHAVHEHVETGWLPRRAALVAGLLTRIESGLRL